MCIRDRALDMLISNYVYEKEGERRKKVIQYRHILPVEKMFTWKMCIRDSIRSLMSPEKQMSASQPLVFP